MKFGALATIGFTLAFGLPATSSFFVGIVVLPRRLKLISVAPEWGAVRRERQSDATGRTIAG